MAEVKTQQAAPLQRVPNVEMMHAGTWSASTGVHTFTSDDFTAAVSALDCPAVRRPVLKLGHVDPRFDGEPAIGFVDHLRTAEDGHALVGDFAGMPGWLSADVLASAWPDRSIEGEWHHRCALGHDHGFVVTAVALLGVAPPAIGTLSSFQDIAGLYAVSDSTEPEETPVPTPVTVSAAAPTSVALSVTAEDIRRAYYERPEATYLEWIEEIQLSPELQVIVHDDESNSRSRVPVTVGDGDGTAAVAFGDPIPVVIRYEDQAAAKVAASAGRAHVGVTYASREASRAETKTTQGETHVTTLHQAARELLGITDADADDEALIAALSERITAAPAEAAPAEAAPVAEPVAASAGSGTVTVDAAQFESLRRQAQLGAAAHDRQVSEDRERVLTEAVRAGKFPPARLEHYRAMLAADPEGGRAVIDGLAPGLIPVEETGHAHSDVKASADLGWFDGFTATKTED